MTKQNKFIDFAVPFEQVNERNEGKLVELQNITYLPHLFDSDSISDLIKNARIKNHEIVYSEILPDEIPNQVLFEDFLFYLKKYRKLRPLPPEKDKYSIEDHKPLIIYDSLSYNSKNIKRIIEILYKNKSINYFEVTESYKISFNNLSHLSKNIILFSNNPSFIDYVHNFSTYIGSSFSLKTTIDLVFRNILKKRSILLNENRKVVSIRAEFDEILNNTHNKSNTLDLFLEKIPENEVFPDENSASAIFECSNFEILENNKESSFQFYKFLCCFGFLIKKINSNNLYIKNILEDISKYILDSFYRSFIPIDFFNIFRDNYEVINLFFTLIDHQLKFILSNTESQKRDSCMIMFFNLNFKLLYILKIRRIELYNECLKSIGETLSRVSNNRKDFKIPHHFMFFTNIYDNIENDYEINRCYEDSLINVKSNISISYFYKYAPLFFDLNDIRAFLLTREDLNETCFTSLTEGLLESLNFDKSTVIWQESDFYQKHSFISTINTVFNGLEAPCFLNDIINRFQFTEDEFWEKTYHWEAGRSLFLTLLTMSELRTLKITQFLERFQPLELDFASRSFYLGIKTILQNRNLSDDDNELLELHEREFTDIKTNVINPITISINVFIFENISSSDFYSKYSLEKNKIFRTAKKYLQNLEVKYIANNESQSRPI